MADFAKLPSAVPPQVADSDLAGLACRVIDGMTPCLAVGLEPGQSVLAVMSVLLWRDPGVMVERGEGELILLRGPGRAAFAQACGGTIFPVPLAPGAAVQIAGAHMLIALGAAVGQERIKGLGDRLTGGEGFSVDRVTAGPLGGVVWVQGSGSVFERGLIEGESIDLRGGAFLCKDTGVRIENVFPLQDARGDLDLALLRCTGPGRVALQTGPAVRLASSTAAAGKRGLMGRHSGA